MEKAGIEMHHFAYPLSDDLAVKQYRYEIVKELNMFILQ